MKPIDDSMLSVETRELTKRYDGNILAVDSISIKIAANTIYSLLGPNGAGKTTMVSMLTTLIKPTGGSATVAGFDVVRQAGDVRRRIGVTFQEMVVDNDLTGRQVLDYHGRLYGQGTGQRRKKTGE